MMITCRADGCSEHHLRHFCRLCDENDSDHLSRNCPQASTLFHGTTADAATNITEEGLKCSPVGRLGPGVYFVDYYEYALKIARRRNPDNWAVLECKVNIGPPIAGNKSPKKTKRLYGTVSFHPPWAGIKNNFMEYCLTNEIKCHVVEKISEGGEFIIMNKEAIPKRIDQMSQARDFPARNLPTVAVARHPAAVQWQMRQPAFVAPWQIQAAPRRHFSDIFNHIHRCLVNVTGTCGKALEWKPLKLLSGILILLSFIPNFVNSIYCIVQHWPDTDKLTNETVETVPRDIQNSYISFSVFCVLHLIGSITLLGTCLFTDKWKGMGTCSAILYQLGKYVLLDMPMYVSHACLIKLEMKFKENEDWDPYFWDLLLQLGFFIETIAIILVMAQATRRYKIIALISIVLLLFYAPVWMAMQSPFSGEPFFFSFFQIDPSDLGTFTEGGRSHKILVFLCFIGFLNLYFGVAFGFICFLTIVLYLFMLFYCIFHRLRKCC